MLLWSVPRQVLSFQQKCPYYRNTLGKFEETSQHSVVLALHNGWFVIDTLQFIESF